MLDLARGIAEQSNIFSLAGNDDDSWCNDSLCVRRLGKDPFGSVLLGGLKLELSWGTSHAFEQLNLLNHSGRERSILLLVLSFVLHSHCEGVRRV